MDYIKDHSTLGSAATCHEVTMENPDERVFEVLCSTGTEDK